MVMAIASQDEHGRMTETAFITPPETLHMICPALALSDVQPYLGLAAFGETDAEFFFGRRREVERLLASLGHEPRFLVVLVPSGSGKSSVIGAGLIPRLRRGAVPGSDRWGIITARPGDRPLENLQAGGLEGAGKGLVEAAQSWLAKNKDTTRSRWSAMQICMTFIDAYNMCAGKAAVADLAYAAKHAAVLQMSEMLPARR
jgi:hypothetical protein